MPPAQAGVLHRAQHLFDHLRWRQPMIMRAGVARRECRTRPERVVVEHRGSQRQSHLVLGLEAVAGVKVLGCNRRQLQRAQHRAPVRQPDAHAAELAVVVQLAHVLQLALCRSISPSRMTSCARRGPRRALHDDPPSTCA